MFTRRAEFWVRVTLGYVAFGLGVGWYVLRRLLPGTAAARREAFARTMSRLTCPMLGLRVRVENGAALRAVSPCVFAVNHQSYLDYPILGSVYSGNTLILASQVGDWPILGPIYRSSGSLVVDRRSPVHAAAALDEAERAVRERGHSIWVFVEGTRSPTPGTMLPFKRGAFRLAARTGAPIVPIVVSQLKPWSDLRGRRLQARDVVVQVLDPVYAEGTTEADERRLMGVVRHRMLAALHAAPTPPAA